MNAILFEELHVSTECDLEESAKLCLHRETEFVTVGQAQTGSCTATSSGDALLEELQDQKTTLAILQSKIINL